MEKESVRHILHETYIMKNFVSFTRTTGQTIAPCLRKCSGQSTPNRVGSFAILAEVCPCNFYLFQQVKSKHKVASFEKIELVIAKSVVSLNSWKRMPSSAAWGQCIIWIAWSRQCKGMYIEGDTASYIIGDE